MPWLLPRHCPPHVLEGLRNSSQPAWVGLEGRYFTRANMRGQRGAEQIQGRVASEVCCGLGAFGEGVGNGFILLAPSLLLF